ncbi:hypothetical protein [Amycolatopsis regifaucium]|uniref:Uncharacterized protein n=1 Tax=Amycolatopsis regifaucium TaxID=546365 RepID=A0A154MHN5_9PSEU|nr:hypothetical protein [Amycolatopsis regifaucium]KZB83912.1 hypothetical protein AVL48_35680 [Amycolatopsis regifaucium]OKA06645.1 hypothetical protein ATP06_0218925 [Amycolatopsis regifaucium]SFH22605.1 hypothetical protein SAMN04489731_10373 [Amycolatopsis regifaucium]
MYKKLAEYGAPVLAICAVLALPMLGSTAAYAGDDGETPPSSTVTSVPTTAGSDGNPWHG